ncbi:hypothetical protein ACM64Y_14605 [Novispirillum sp. DQ9]|uniref:hypothetical protein n=1 Tax=Novispirillum sp. DQ9 TaxID=3398612 RepID=UPI003C7D013C
MRAYLFTCSVDAGIQAASILESGANLPQDPCRDGFWDQTGSLEIAPDGDGTVLLPNLDHKTLVRCLGEKGWVIDTAAATEA